MSNSHTRKPTSTSRYTSLTPVDNADIENSYGEALRFAIENPDINNIAITGPYGSGKSSIIKSFEKKNNKYNFLKISLASFKDQDVEILKIERSILQQMLYGADAKKLPYSRFKVISTPEYPLLKSLMFLVWILSAYFAFRDGEKFFNVTPVSFDWFVGLVFLIYFISFTVFAIESIYKKTFGFQLKKFSLKNAEIETGDIPESSILNRHLDEIIYFFQVTDYHVVVIEDLDRFGNPEIFVKLREINKLVNDNAKINRQVKFLYALKDDMFAHKNRAKFFGQL
ncbi:MAG: P-loop NTPase fold protein [Candidatus Thiodiazotropha endolucinida]